MLRLHIRRMALEDGRIEFSDQAVSPAYDAVIAPLSILVTDLSSLPNTEGRYRLAARSSSRFRIWGSTPRKSTSPARIRGAFSAWRVSRWRRGISAQAAGASRPSV